MVLAAAMALMALWGGFGAFQAFTNEPQVLASLGFEAVVLLTGLAGIWFALKDDESGRAIGLLNLGGVLVVASLTSRFAWHTTVNPDALGVGASARLAFTDVWFLLRGGLGLVLVGWAVVVALGAEAAGWKRLVLGTVLAVPFVVGVMLTFRLGVSTFFPSITDVVTAFRMAGGLLAALVLSVMFAVGVHYIIKAFERAVPHASRVAAA